MSEADRVRQQSAAQLTHPIFLGSLALLAVNDAVLKQAWPGLVTGKASDVAGLLLVGWLLYRSAPHQYQWSAGLLSLGFAWFKLPVSEPALSALGRVLGVMPTRTVDATDLWALVVVPFVPWIVRVGVPLPARRWLHTGLLAVAAVAVVATSAPTHFVDFKSARVLYRMPGSTEATRAAIDTIRDSVLGVEGGCSSDGCYLTQAVPWCSRGILWGLTLAPGGPTATAVKVDYASMALDCKKDAPAPAELLNVLEPALAKVRSALQASERAAS